ncbi:MAG: DUF72 domain-containing protein [Anaerolineae bacterium]
MNEREIYVGIAGWSIPKEHAHLFPTEGSHLQRYAKVIPAVEINSSFYRAHRMETYQRWASSVPEGFRFAVKAPRDVTHGRRLRDASPLRGFAEETAGLGDRLGPWLIQLPPSLAFQRAIVERFLTDVRALFNGPIAIEPRHPSWFDPAIGALLESHRVARVVADPAIHPAGVEPAGWEGLVYFRLHGSPRMYYSGYSEEALARLAERVTSAAGRGATVWCIFNNTAAGEAIPNALALMEILGLNWP